MNTGEFHIENYIDLERYSESKGFAGFTENMSNESVKNYLYILKKTCENQNKNAFILCKTYVNELIKINDPDKNEIQKMRSERRLVGSFSDLSWHSCVLLNESDIDVALKVLSFFIRGYLLGHAFLVFPRLGLIVYPHNDIGFGFVYFD